MSSPARFRLLASFVAGRALDVYAAPAGERAYTDGHGVFVPSEASASEQRQMVLVQAALLHEGSLEARFIKSLRGREAQRYLALEGRRALAALAVRLMRAAEAAPTKNAEESLRLAKGRAHVEDPPASFGVIHPARLLASAEDAQESKFLRLLENPLFNSETVADFLSKLFGRSESSREGSSSAGMFVRSARRAKSVGPHARPMPVTLHVTDGAAAGVAGALYPEWNVYDDAYRPAWCRVLEFPLRGPADLSAAGVAHDEVLRRRLARLGLGPKLLRRRAEGDELDLEALIDFRVELRAGHSPAPLVYTERRKLARNLGVLILVDASGSATDVDERGHSVHERQRRAAATLAVTLEELGDRVAVYGFRSHGRSSVHCIAIKPFAQRFSAGGRSRLQQLQPDGYTRLGAGIRHAGEILKARAGTPHRLLLVLSDGVPYDDGYEAGYAEADTRRALEELRAAGVACLCLSLGASTSVAALQRVFGGASHANAPWLKQLSPRMDQLFSAALQELAAPNARDPRRSRLPPSSRLR